MEFLKEKIKIFPLKEEDIKEIDFIEQVSFKSPWEVQSFRRELKENQFAYYLAAHYENKVIGYIGSWIFLNEAHITTLAVHPDFRKKGVGELILNNFLKDCLNKKVKGVILEVRESNSAARNLYKKFGFKEISKRTRYYEFQEDAVVMRLLIKNQL